MVEMNFPSDGQLLSMSERDAWNLFLEGHAIPVSLDKHDEYKARRNQEVKDGTLVRVRMKVGGMVHQIGDTAILDRDKAAELIGQDKATIV